MLAIFRSEMRELWRSVGVRVFLLLLVGATTLAFVLGSQLHGVYSAEYPLVGFLGPPFFMSRFGIYLLVLALAGAFLIASRFDGMVDAVAVRPASNLMLLGGRTFALAATTWLSMVAALAVAQGVGTATRGFDEDALIEPFSIACFLVVDALPATVFWCALVVLLHVVLRRRLFVVLAGLTLLALFWSALSLPAWVQSTVVPVVALQRHVSEITPWFVDVWTVLQRGSMLSCGVGALMLAAGLHRRREDGGSSRRLPGALFALVGSLGLGCVALHEAERNDRREKWAAAHELASRASVGFDVEAIAGQVLIEPGVELGIDIVLRLNTHRNLQALVFSLNPAMRIADVRVAQQEAAFRHEDGLLTVDLPAPVVAGATLTLGVVASGVPDSDFAYLDSAVDPRRVAGSNSIRLLGTEALIFDRAYMALMPATFWLPAAGANYGREYGREDSSRRPTDFFDVDLAVDVPATWHVAGGFRERADEAGEKGRRTFRYRPAAPVDEIGLFAAAFDRRVLHAGNVEIELLFHPAHLRNVDLFAESKDVVASYATEILAHVESQGIGYPYASLSVVEVPAYLRSYRGGWRMEPALRLPGIVGVREVAFPTAHFKALADLIDSAIDAPEAAANAKAGHLITYSRQADLLRGLANSLLNTVAGAGGDDALALDLLCLELADRLLPRPNSVRTESAHLFDKNGSPALLVEMLSSLPGGARSVLRDLLARHDPTADRPMMWDRLTSGGVDADAGASRTLETLGVLALRVGKAAQAIVDAHGQGRSAALLSALRTRYAGRTFTIADLIAVADAIDLPLASLLDPWLHGNTLPGFVASSAKAVRLRDDESGPRYQARLHVHNEQDAPGLVALSADRYRLIDSTSPVVVDGLASVELEWVGSEPPDVLWLHPYLSANRHPFAIQVAEVVDGVQPASLVDAHFGARTSDWRPAQELGVIVDDLDPGFAVETDTEARWRFQLSDLTVARPLDQGMLLYERGMSALRRNTWHREVVPTAWGRYRRTIALAQAGDGGARAVASARLPSRGRWALAFHVPLSPPPDFPGERAPEAHLRFLGGYDMRLRTAKGETSIEFDGRAANFGWNTLGVFDMPAGEVQLVVTNRTFGDIVLFDAIRWRQSEPSS